MKKRFLVVLAVITMLGLAGCQNNTDVDVPEANNTPQATATVAPTKEVEPTEVVTPTEEPEPTEAAESTVTPEPTVTPKPTATPEPTATPVPTATPESTATPVPTEAPKKEMTEDDIKATIKKYESILYSGLDSVDYAWIDETFTADYAEEMKWSIENFPSDFSKYASDAPYLRAYDFTGIMSWFAEFNELGETDDGATVYYYDVYDGVYDAGKNGIARVYPNGKIAMGGYHTEYEMQYDATLSKAKVQSVKEIIEELKLYEKAEEPEEVVVPEKKFDKWEQRAIDVATKLCNIGHNGKDAVDYEWINSTFDSDDAEKLKAWIASFDDETTAEEYGWSSWENMSDDAWAFDEFHITDSTGYDESCGYNVSATKGNMCVDIWIEVTYSLEDVWVDIPVVSQ